MSFALHELLQVRIARPAKGLSLLPFYQASPKANIPLMSVFSFVLESSMRGKERGKMSPNGRNPSHQTPEQEEKQVCC